VLDAHGLSASGGDRDQRMSPGRAVATVRRILPTVTSLQTRGVRARTCVYPGIGHSSMLLVY